MGSLMGLCPPPDEWGLLDWCTDFHILPSQLKAEDWKWLKAQHDRKWLTGWYEVWNRVAAGEGSMPQDIVQYLLKLSDEAEAKWRTSDSGS